MGLPGADGEVEVVGAIAWDGAGGFRGGDRGYQGEECSGQEEELDQIIHKIKLWLKSSKGMVFPVGRF